MAKQSKAAKLAAEIKANNAAREVKEEPSTSTTEHEMVLVQPTKAQDMMIEDGLPEKAIISNEEREEGWKENPPRTTTWNETPATKETSAEVLAFAAEEKAKKDIVKHNRLAKLNNKNKFDPTTHSWDAKNNKAVPLPGVEQPKKATKLNVTKIKKAAEKKAGVQKKAVPKKEKVKKETKPGKERSPIAEALNLRTGSKHETIAQFLEGKLGKMVTEAAIIKHVYNDPAVTKTNRITDLIKVMEKGKYEIKTDNKNGVLSYGLFKK